MTRTDVVRRQFAHFGIILCHLSLAGFAFLLAGVLSSVLSVFLIIFAFLVLILLIFCTLGIIFLARPTLFSDFGNFIENVGKFSGKFFEYMPLIGTLSIALCICSIIFTAMDLKWEKSKVRFVLSIFILVFMVVTVLLVVLGIIRGEQG